MSHRIAETLVRVVHAIDVALPEGKSGTSKIDREKLAQDQVTLARDGQTGPVREIGAVLLRRSLQPVITKLLS